MDPQTKEALKLLQSTDYITGQQKSYIRRRLSAVHSMESQLVDRSALFVLCREFDSMNYISKEVRQKILKYFEKYDMVALDELINETIAKERQLERYSLELHSNAPKSPTRYLKKNVNDTLSQLEVSSSVSKHDGQE